ncbi:Rxt3-domain-containing protein [Polyplosphaeria fusca]|uniref:Rxt3-domain-containing protein n=1 Tax=Polyplosphaeria fusca TaxID=682080 RepID=A0A9P4RCL4_9PLEO|nr:Rxt3-domain-containing protein [Polyplosphaeria fusca]
MDSRQPQHPFTRPPDRPLIRNPNHQSPPQPSQTQPFPSYAPPASHAQQPALHVPFQTGPSSRHDPFYPSSTHHHARQASYGAHGGESAAPAQGERHGWANTAPQHAIHHASHHHAHSGPPPPPSMTNSHNTPAQPYGYDAARRGSLGGGSPPNHPYTASSHDPPPPPPSFARSHMPPPSSPQQQHNHSAHAASQRPSFAPSFAANRELPGLASAHRPGSSMSISSLIGGGDSAASSHTPQNQSSPTSASANAPLFNNHAMQPPSPRRGPPPASRADYPPYRHPPSPDRPLYPGGAPRLQEGHGYSARSPPRSYSNHGSPEQPRQTLAQSSQPYKPMVFQGPRSYASPPNEAQARDPRSSSNIPPRPNSQPTGPPGHLEQDARGLYDNLGRRSAYGPPEERRRTLEGSQYTRPNVVELLATAPQSSSDRDRPVTVQPVAQSAFSPPRDSRAALGPTPAARHPWVRQAPEDPRESHEPRRDEQPLYRGYGGYSSASQPPNPVPKHGPEDMVRGRSLDHLSQRVAEQYHAAPTSDPQTNERQRAEQLSRSLSSGGSGYPRSLYDQSRRPGDDMALAKSFLANLGPEANRKTGRASPLPQAVQGAQAQPFSIGKDPSIKSEFGRMFSGLGSGLGTSTPSRQSPMPQGGSEPPPITDLNDLRLQRVSSQTGRKPKRVKDEDGLFENESIDGRGTPNLGARGSKRNKHNHGGHHHHHYAHAHHHHHHHLKGDEEFPQNGGSTPQPHHHHHYHGGAHHHHHAPRAGQPASLHSALAPPKVHDIQAVLDEASQHPRAHLGSYLYEAMPELPVPSSSLDDQFCYASKPKPIPRFERNPINCTVTVRIPRYYLKPRQRQQMVLQRHLWGARVYRDDSDPIAAAIHSGWIRGEWDETVDVGYLDPRITAPNDASDAEPELKKVPAAPVTPPADMELQIDLLILPRIHDYVGTVEYGMSSRRSSNHDGLSFMVHRMRWVEEGFGSRGQERGAAAMKRRLDASTTLLSLLDGGDDVLRKVNGTAKLHA